MGRAVRVSFHKLTLGKMDRQILIIIEQLFDPEMKKK